MSIVLMGSTSGSITLQEPAIAGNNTISVPAETGTILTSVSPSSVLPSSVNGPAFSAICNMSQTLSSNTWTKLTYNQEEFDTNNNYDNATNYRFTPTVAGYYQVNGQLQPNSSYCGGAIAIYKNGSSFKIGTFAFSTTFGGWTVSALVFLNGSTDYIELYGNMTTGQLVSGGSTGFSYFQAAMVRGA